MTLYFLLNIALLVLVAGLVPTLARGEDDDAGATQEQIEALKELLKLKKQDAELDRELASSLQKRAEKMGDVTAAYENQRNLLEASARLAKENISEAQKELALAEQAYKLGKESGEADAKKLAEIQERIEKLHVELALNEQQVAMFKAQLDLQSDINSKMHAIIGAKTFDGSFLGKLTKTIKEDDGSLGNALTSIGKGFKEAVRPANLVKGAISKVQEMTILQFHATDAAMASFQRATAAGREYSKELVNLHRTNLELGVSVEKAAEQYQALFTAASDFTEMSEVQRKAVAKNNSMLNNLGIESGVAAEQVQVLTKGLGFSRDDLIDVQNDLAATAKQIGVAPGKMAADFNAAAPQLAAWGKDATKVFKGLAAASKATGIEMSALLGIVGKMDTFEGAAEAAGKLNAVLGGNLLNSTELLMATEEERVRMLNDAVASSGKAWEDMGKFERMAIANAAGISDMAEANKLFGTSLSAYDDFQKKAKEGTVTFADLMQQSKDGIPLAEKLRNLMSAMAVSMRPVILGLGMLVDKMLWLNDITSGWVIPAATAAGAAFMGLHFYLKLADSQILKSIKGTFAWIAAKFKKTAAAQADSLQTKLNTEIQKENNDVLEEGEKKQDKAGKTAKKSAKEMLAFGAAIMMIGVGVGIAALGMAEFVKAFSGMEVSQILAVSVAIGVFGLSMALLAKIMVTAGTVAAPAMLAFGASFVMIGAGVFLAAVGMGLFAKAIVGLFKSGGLTLENVLLFGLLSTAILGLSAAMGVFGAVMASPFGFVALAGLAAVVTGLTLALKAAGPELLALAAIFAEIGNITATAKVDVEGGEGGVLIQTVQAVEKLENLGELENTRMVAEYAMKLNAAAPAAAPAPAAVAAGGGAGSSEVILQINERELGRVVVDLIKSKYNLKIAKS